MSAALFSAIRGAKTLLVEKTGFVGGTSALSAGSIWIPNTRHASAVGSTDDAANVEKYLQQIVGNHADIALRAAFLKAGREMKENGTFAFIRDAAPSKQLKAAFAESH